MTRILLKSLLSMLLALCASDAFEQMPNPYGAPISLESAKNAAAATAAEARKNNWNMAIAITDPVMDGKTVGAIGVSGAAGDQDAQCAKAGVDTLK